MSEIQRNRGEVYWDGAFRLFETFDPAVTALDKTLFQIEFKAIFLELFSLAWTHRVHRRDLIMLQELFTRSYAESTNNLAVWEAVDEYNRSVSDSGWAPSASTRT